MLLDDDRLNSEFKTLKNRILISVKDVLPKTTKLAIWLVKITVGVSFALLLLEYFNILPYISNLLSPLFNLVGLSGEVALAYISGYFGNIYSAIAVAVTLDLDVRSMTILGVMSLCAHNMITETLVQKKTGSSAIRMVIIRTISSISLGLLLNLFLPAQPILKTTEIISKNPDFLLLFQDWLPTTLALVFKMVFLVYSLSIIQRLLSEFGVIRLVSKFMAPLLVVFGLPKKTAFLWIVANVLGLAYGATIMIDEAERGLIKRRDIDLLNTHISISHSNFEDMFLFASVGALWPVALISRWLFSILLVWEQRLEYYIVDRIKK